MDPVRHVRFRSDVKQRMVEADFSRYFSRQAWECFEALGSDDENVGLGMLEGQEGVWMLEGQRGGVVVGRR